MRKRSMQTISDVQKVWHRVMSIRFRTGNQAVRIPSSNELAREFGIARSSVRIALEQLTAEGILITRKGCGTFINPKRTFFLHEKSTLIGLMIQGCNNFFYSRAIQRELACFFSELYLTEWNVRNVEATMLTPDDVRMTIQHNYLDALLTFGTPGFIVKTADELLPLVNLGTYRGGVTNVVSDLGGCIEELFRITGRNRDILIWNLTSPEGYLSRSLGSKTGVIRFPGTEDLTENAVTAELLRKMFAKRCPDWILIHPDMLELFRGVIVERYGEEQARKILWLYHTVPDTTHDWTGYFIRADRRKEVRAAIALLKRKMNGETVTGDVSVPAQLLRCPDDPALLTMD